MYLGIEIGGTKLQLGVGSGDSGKLVELKRHQVDRSRGALGILEQIEVSVTSLIQKHDIESIGVGFGGPVDALKGVAIKSHQVPGWEMFNLVSWFENHFRRPAVIGNDCDCATIAESCHGSGRESRSVFYVTVGTGIGGGLVVDGELMGSRNLGGLRPAVAELGHMRPGPQSDRAEMTVESIASGSGIANSVKARIAGAVAGSIEEVRDGDEIDDDLMLRIATTRESDDEFAADLLERCEQDLSRLDGRIVAQAAADGNEIARLAIDHAITVLGWGIAQVITLVAPEKIVVGGGVALMGDREFFQPLRKQIDRYVFPVLKKSYQLVPAGLGEEVVVHGAIIIASRHPKSGQSKK